MEEILDITKLTYVLYARKSTDDPERQVRSIDDQIEECIQLANRLGLRVVKPPLIEKQSAKKPNKRPLFMQMLKDIKTGKYDGILTWAPDRLSRNMREGGEIIDMIDEGYIKDLKFVTYTFSNDPNGKMLLGMAFVLSKQYSDKLSQDVTRGVRRNFAEGKTPTHKHGYYHDISGLNRPDGKNFELICEAWERRKQGEALESIANWMNEQGYRRIIKRSGKEVDMDKRILTDLFKDPFYYGILIQKGNPMDLRELYDFEPAISEETYITVQSMNQKKTIPYNKRRSTFYPFKMMIICSFCNRHMYGGPSTSKTKERFLYYRCDNKLCLRKKKSVRAKVILDFIYQVLENGLHLTEEDYTGYYNRMTIISDDKRSQIEHDRYSKQSFLNNINREMTERSLKLVNFEKESTVYKINEKRINELEDQKEDLEEQIVSLKEQLTNPEQDRLTLEDFLNLSKNAGRIVKSGDAIVKDKICRLIFLNFTVDEEKVLSFQSKPPFDRWLRMDNIRSSRG